MSQGTTAVTLVPALIGLWLVGLSYGDLRTRTVPAWATVLPLAVLGLLRTTVIPPDGAVVPGGVAVGFALLMLLLSDTPSAVFPAGAAAFCAGLSGEQAQVLVVGIALLTGSIVTLLRPRPPGPALAERSGGAQLS